MTASAAHNQAEQAAIELVAHFIAAIEAGDAATVEASYHPDARIWHNFDLVEQTRAENLATLRWVIANVADRRYEIVRREAFGGGAGVLQQHILHGTVSATGATLMVPAALVVLLADGLITRLDEYLDTAQVAVLRAQR